MELAKITSKGQITIPIEIRKKLGVRDGDKVLFIEDGNRIYMTNSSMQALTKAQEDFKGVADELGIKNQDIVSLAKRIEEVFIPHKSIPVLFPTNSQALFFFQRIRDEAHRFAITFHRQLRGKSALHSELDEIKGLYQKNKKLLFDKYSSVSKISKLTKEELMLLLSKNQAQLVYDFFNTQSKNLDIKNSD